MTIIFRPYKDGDEKSIMQRFNEAFDLTRGTDYWRWKFLHDGDPLVMLAVDENDAVQCQMAGLRTVWQGSGVHLPVVQVGDVFTRRTPELIRQKVMLKTFVAFHRLYSPRPDIQLLFGFPNKRLSALHNTQDPLSEAGKSVTTYRRDNACSAVVENSDGVVREWPDERSTDSLWLAASNRYRLSSARDHAWLTQRFTSRPDVDDYQCLIFRRRDGSIGSWTVVRSVGETLWICDLVWDGRSASELQALDSAVLALSKEMGLKDCGLWLQGDESAVDVLSAQGWQDHTHEQFVALAMHLYDKTLDATWLYENLYLTYADSDLI